VRQVQRARAMQSFAGMELNAPPHVPDRQLEAPTRQLQLQQEAAPLRQAAGQAPAGHTAKTLVKLRGLRVVLMVLERGSRIPEHTAEADLSLQCLRGRVALSVQGRRFELAAGELLSLARELPHDVEALEDAELLLTLGDPER
jgi:quercetin dioxygenase-like cupin family protein